MTKCFYVTSCIDVETDIPFTYSKKRSFFSNEERFKQTIYTVNSIKCLCPDAHIFVLDTSKPNQTYEIVLESYSGVQYIPMIDYLNETEYKTITEGTHKTIGELTLIQNFIKNFKFELQEYDYLFKMSGRYFLDHTFDPKVFKRKKIYFKSPLRFEWKDSWNYSMVDQRDKQGDNFLYQYCSVFYGYHASYLDYFENLYSDMMNIISDPDNQHYDIETLMYFLTRKSKKSIIENDVLVNGWDGSFGNFFRY